MNIKPFIKSLRIRQYPKNVLIFAGLIFDGQLTHIPALAKTCLGFLIFCALSSGIYFLNDIVDVESDRKHPKKKNRPIAAGQISIRNAKISAAALIGLSLGAAATLERHFFLICLATLIINIFYSLYLKHQPIIDVMVIGILFILRVAAGISLITVKIFSPWLYVVTFMLALFLGFGKRRAELAMLTDSHNDVRPVLDGYTLPLLDQLITIVSSVTIMAYTLYTFSGPTLPSHNKMMITLPFAVFGVFRYHYLLQVEHKGGAPEEVLLSDHALQTAIVLFGCAAIYAIYS